MKAATTTKARLVSKRRAEALIDEIREGLLNAERSLMEFINGYGWVVLGFVSFQEFWHDRLSDIRLASDAMRATVVYALFYEGANDESVIEALGGRIGDEAIAALRRQWSNGVPPEFASTRVRGHLRGLPNHPSDFRIKLDPEERAQWKEAIEAHGHDWHEWMVRVLRREVSKLERSGVGR